MKIGKEARVFVVLNTAVVVSIGLGYVFGYATIDTLISIAMGVNIGALISYAIRHDGE